MRRWFTYPRRLALIVVAAVALRLAFLLVAGQTLSLQASGYDEYAVNLISGQGYTRFADLHPDSDLPPLYSFFLAGVYSIFGRSAIAVALVQIGLDVLTLLALAAIARRVGGEGTALVAVALTGFYPYLLFQNLSVNDTGIFITLMTLGVWAAYRVWEKPSWRWAAFAGLLFGVAALTKTLIALLLPLIALWWWWRLGFASAFRQGLVMAFVFAAVILPWVVRNTQLHGTLTLISTNDGSNLHQGNNPCVADYLLAGWDAQWVDCLAPTPAGLSETEASTWHRDQALTYLATNPGEVPRLFAVKLLTLWSPELLPRTVPPSANLDNAVVLQYEQPLFQAARVIHVVYFTPLLILGGLGLLRAAQEGELTGKVAPLWMILLVITAAYVVYHPSTRYRSPADPFLFIFSASALVWLWRQRRKLIPAKS